MFTFHVNPVRINIYVEVLVQILLCGTFANLFDLQETSAPRSCSLFGLRHGFLRNGQCRNARLRSHGCHDLSLAQD
jgi:hypothetical protein